MIELDFITKETIYAKLGGKKISTNNCLDALLALKKHIDSDYLNQWIAFKEEEQDE